MSASLRHSGCWKLAILGLAGLTLLEQGCASASRPQQFRTFFLPPAPAPAPAPAVGTVAAPPEIDVHLFANESPLLAPTVTPGIASADQVIKRANDQFEAGKRAVQEGRTADARRAFDRAIEILLTAPANLPDHARVEQRLDDMADDIYHYDADQLGAGDSGDQISYEKPPLDGIIDEMTFPVDPSLRNKVRAQIQATTSELPLEENDAVIRYINFFTSERGRKIMIAGLRRAGRYRPMIEKTLAAEGLPRELIFLAMEESGFFPHALSNKLCVGMWQFAKSRGEEYGLQVTPYVDARMDPESATRAAARHLHDLYSHFGDWYLAMAAYNCGPLCIDRAVQKTGYADFWKLSDMNVLPQGTPEYVPAILAMIIISKNAADYGLTDIQPDRPLEYDTLEMTSTTNLALVASALERSVSELRDLNPALLRTVAPAGYGLHIPKGTKERVEEALNVVPASRRDSWRIHEMESGDTFASLARRYGTTEESLRAANHDELPEAGAFVAVPVSYPGQRTAVKRRASRRTEASTQTRSSHARTREKTAVASTHKRRTAHHRSASIAQKSAAKPARRAPGA